MRPQQPCGARKLGSSTFSVLPARTPTAARYPWCLRASVLLRKRVAAAAVAMTAAITGLAALLQWIWAGWSVYSGPGPSLALRWLLTGAVGAALLLPWAAAIGGAAVGRRIADSGLRDQFRVTRRGTGHLALWAGGWALAPPLL